MNKEKIIHTSVMPARSFFLLILIVFLVQTMNMTTAFAQGHVYWAGDKIRRADLDGNNQQVVCNFPGTDVAVDAVNGKIFWGDNSTGTGRIFMANLNGCAAPTVLLTTPRIDQMQIDVTNQKIYWMNASNNRIYRSNITPLLRRCCRLIR